ncbi:hypothetical protein C2E25_04885 [Geothermobacter hydrogeniphilus]|uniref:Glycosyl transferase family 25 domain-containing protein n=2 Tax=Geothermobacter hydrogeniphilus TaxID=1969733 RepID=A0A2K2HCA7_9BACT|nr:hypothetical protein C2E25_04885 [Geothermobacter hydrogeniphilus]
MPSSTATTSPPCRRWWKRSRASTGTPPAMKRCCRRPGSGTGRSRKHCGPKPMPGSSPTSSTSRCRRPIDATAAVGGRNGNANCSTCITARTCRPSATAAGPGDASGTVFCRAAKCTDAAHGVLMHTTRRHCPIYVITLDHARERQQTISARLRELGLAFEFISGVDGRGLKLENHPDYEPIKRRLFYGRDLSQGEFGCILAHRNVYRHMQELQVEMAVVLEDDSILTEELPEVIEALARIADNWDLVRFLGRDKNYRSTRSIRPLEGTSAMLARQLGIPGGAYGYMLNLKAAKRLSRMTQKNWLAIDTLHGAVWLTGLRTLAVAPSPVLPNDESPSCIDSQDNNLRWDKTVRLEGGMRLIYPVTRGLWKFYLACCTGWIRLKSLLGDRGDVRRVGTHGS